GEAVRQRLRPKQINVGTTAQPEANQKLAHWSVSQNKATVSFDFHLAPCPGSGNYRNDLHLVKRNGGLASQVDHPGGPRLASRLGSGRPGIRRRLPTALPVWIAWLRHPPGIPNDMD